MVKHRGHVQELEPGKKYRVFVHVGRDEFTGRRRVLTKTFHGSRRDAEDEAARMYLSVRDGATGTAPVTFEGLLDRWLIHAEKVQQLAPWTLRGYRSKIDNHIRPVLGDVKLSKLTPARLDGFYADLLERGKTVTVKGKKKRVGLAPQSVRHCHSIIHRACEQGRRWGWLDRNPAELAEPPTVNAEERALPTIAEIGSIMEKLTADMRELVWVALITGARRGELCGLRWSDIDLEHVDHGQVTIARSIVDLPDRIVVKTPKTRKPRRLAIDGMTTALLRARFNAQRTKAKTCEVEHAQALGYVFADEPGAREPLRPALVTKRWANAARAAGVRCTFHDLRHVSVTELLDAGFDVGEVGARAGHASKVMTLDRYGHSRRAGDLAAAEHLAALLAPPAG